LPECDKPTPFANTWSFEKAGVKASATVIYKNNDFPHLTKEGNIAVSEILRESLPDSLVGN